MIVISYFFFEIVLVPVAYGQIITRVKPTIACSFCEITDIHILNKPWNISIDGQ